MTKVQYKTHSRLSKFRRSELPIKILKELKQKRTCPKKHR